MNPERNGKEHGEFLPRSRVSGDFGHRLAPRPFSDAQSLFSLKESKSAAAPRRSERVPRTSRPPPLRYLRKARAPVSPSDSSRSSRPPPAAAKWISRFDRVDLNSFFLVCLLIGGCLALGMQVASPDPDLWGHIRFGQYTLQSGQFLWADPYSANPLSRVSP